LITQKDIFYIGLKKQFNVTVGNQIKIKNSGNIDHFQTFKSILKVTVIVSLVQQKVISNRIAQKINKFLLVENKIFKFVPQKMGL